MKSLVSITSWIFEVTVLQLLICKISTNLVDDECSLISKTKFCFCQDMTFGNIRIICENVTDSNQLKEDLNFPWENFHAEEFVLRNSSVETLLADTVKKLSVYKFIFLNNSLNKIDKFVFGEDQSSATSALFSQNNFGPEFNLEFLHSLRKLREVEFSQNNLLSIPDEAFGNLSYLEYITIRKNNLRKIGKLSFASLPRLRIINLQRNQIEKLEANTFKTLMPVLPSHKITLDLSHNQIQEIEPNAFLGSHATTIDLTYNKLTTLTQTVFEPFLDSMSRDEDLKLLTAGNPFKCDESILWLVKKPPEYRAMVKVCPCLETIDCGAPPKPKYGNIIFMTGTTYKSRVKYSCKRYYTLSENRETECQSDGTWSIQQFSCLEYCSIVSQQRGRYVAISAKNYYEYNMIRIGTKLPNGTQVKFVCDNGYEIVSKNSFNDIEGNVTCNRGQWQPHSQCSPTRCKCGDIDLDKLAERNLSLAENCDDLIPHDQEILLKCNSDFVYPVTNHKMTVKCGKGKWIMPEEEDERCIAEKSCFIQRLYFPHGDVSIGGRKLKYPDGDIQAFQHGVELKFECLQEGYELYVDETPIQNSNHPLNYALMNCVNGRWFGQIPQCKPARCSCAQLSGISFLAKVVSKVCRDSVSSGEYIVLKCRPTFKPIGTLVVQCQMGNWSYSRPFLACA